MKRFIASFYSIAVVFLLVSFVSRDSDVWTGFTSERKLFKKLTWFKEGYNLYTPQAEIVQKLKVAPLTQYKIIAFGGTWCSDTKKVLPKFYKTAHNSGLRTKNINLFFLDKELNSPKGTEKNYHIDHIPTFIIFKEGKEIGRIIEKETITIEEDLLALVNSVN